MIEVRAHFPALRRHHNGLPVAYFDAPGGTQVPRVVTELDHHGNVAPWRALESERGIVVRCARMIPETGQIDYDHLAQLAGPRTKLVAIGGASNALGTINDLARAHDIARGAGALLF